MKRGVIVFLAESIMTQAVDDQNGIAADKEKIAQSDSTSKSIISNTEKYVPAENLELGSHPRDATEHEIATLTHVTDRIPIAAWIVILAGAAERATYFGVIAPWRRWTSSFCQSTLWPPRLTSSRELYAKPTWSSNTWSSWARPVHGDQHLQCLLPLLFPHPDGFRLAVGHLYRKV